MPANIYEHTAASQLGRKVLGASKSPKLYTGSFDFGRNSIALCIPPGSGMSCGWILPTNLQDSGLSGTTEELSV